MNFNKLLPFKNPRYIKYGSFVLLLYLFFLIYTLPASVALSFIKLPPKIKISSFSGTVWSGSATQLQYSGVDLGDIKWKLHPLNLIIAEISADISIVNDEQYFRSEVSLSSSGKLELEESRFMIDLSSFRH